MAGRPQSGVAARRYVDAPDAPSGDNWLGFLIHASGASSWTDAAYRFVRHEPGVHVVLFGTSREEHLRTNIESLLKPPLPEADRQKLTEWFGHLLGVGLELPDHSSQTSR